MIENDCSDSLLLPVPPSQLWMLWSGLEFLTALDCAGNPKLALTSLPEAERCAAAQQEMYDVESVPYRVI